MKTSYPVLLLWTLTWTRLCTYAADSATVLHTAREIRELSAESVSQPHLTELQGVVLGLAEPLGTSLVMQDETDCIYLIGPHSMVNTLSPGDLIAVEGRTDPGGYAPYLRANDIRVVGRTAAPEPRRVSSEELFSKGLDAQWIILTGRVQELRGLRSDELPRGPSPDPSGGHEIIDAKPSPPRMKMTLAVGDRTVPVLLYGHLNPEQYIDAEVE